MAKYQQRHSGRNAVQLNILVRILQAWQGRLQAVAAKSPTADATHGPSGCRALIRGRLLPASALTPLALWPCPGLNPEELLTLADFSFGLTPSLDNINYFAVCEYLEKTHLAQRVRAAGGAKTGHCARFGPLIRRLHPTTAHGVGLGNLA